MVENYLEKIESLQSDDVQSPESLYLDDILTVCSDDCMTKARENTVS